MSEYRWPQGRNVAVKCPKCAKSIDLSLDMVREMNLPVRSGECPDCFADFEVSHDGKIRLVQYGPILNHFTREELLNTVCEFDPTDLAD